MSTKRKTNNKSRKSTKSKNDKIKFDTFINEIENLIKDFDSIFLVDEIEIKE